MKSTIKSTLLKALLLIPLLFFTFCSSEEDEINIAIDGYGEGFITKDSKLSQLMIKVANLGIQKSNNKSTTTGACTGFVFPMSFLAYYGDSPEPTEIIVNNDEELLEFFSTIGDTNPYYVYFPVDLTDAEGTITPINNLTELENTLHTAYGICTDDGSDDSDDDGGPGIRDAHFDVDTSHKVYDFNDGKTDAHTHEYDDKFDTNIVDYFNIETDGKSGKKALHNIHDNEYGVPNKHKIFYIIIANSHLSQDVEIEINGIRTPVMEYQANVDAFLNGNSKALEIYALGESQEAITLTSLKLIVGKNAAKTDNGLIPTETKTVRNNTPGPNGEYRDGALIIQAIAQDNFSLNQDLGVAASDACLLWESTIFWHKKSDDDDDNGGGGDDEDDDDDDDTEYEFCDNKSKKVYICHKGKTKCVSVNAVWGHLNQHKEDYLGQCD